jgi:hypothetical protein
MSTAICTLPSYRTQPLRSAILNITGPVPRKNLDIFKQVLAIEQSKRYEMANRHQLTLIYKLFSLKAL